MIPNPGYAALDNLADRALRAAAILLIAKYGRGFVANISVLLGIIAAASCRLVGKMSFEKVAQGTVVRRRAAVSTSACRPSTRC
jgi:NCS2 family nucleobase:cation symporter-2